MGCVYTSLIWWANSDRWWLTNLDKSSIVAMKYRANRSYKNGAKGMGFTSDPRSLGHIEGSKQFLTWGGMWLLKSPIPDTPVSHKSLGHYLSGPTDPIIIKRTQDPLNILYKPDSMLLEIQTHKISIEVLIILPANNTGNIAIQIQPIHAFNSSGTIHDQSKGDHIGVTSRGGGILLTKMPSRHQACN